MDDGQGAPRRVRGGMRLEDGSDSLNRLVTRITVDFLHVKPERVDEAIGRALSEVCGFVVAECAYVLLLDAHTKAFRVSTRWPATAPANGTAQSLPWLYTTICNGEAIAIDADAAWPPDAAAERANLNALGLESLIAVPMVSDQGVAAALCIGSRTPQHKWTENGLALARMVADIVMTAHERQLAHRALQRRVEAEELIRSIATFVIGLTADELDEGYERALKSIGEFLGADRCYLQMAPLNDSDNATVAGWAGEHSVPFDDEMQTFDIFRSFPAAAAVLARKESIVVSSIENIPAFAENEIAFMKRFQVEAVISTPIHANGRMVGILVAEMTSGPRDWSDIDVMLISTAAQILGGMRVRQTMDDERKRLQRHMEHAQKLESMGVLAGGIAHDFNNLLVGILGNAELMLMDVPDEHPQRKNLEQIESSARRAGDLVNQLLVYTGKGHFKVEPIDVSVLLRNLVTLARTVIPKKIDLQAELEDGVPLVAGDPMQVRQIVMNLITNAAEAMGGASGKIMLCTGFGTFNSEFLSHTVSGEKLDPGDYVIIEVTDTGCGMDDGTKAKIFDPFFTTKFAGRGLGLAATLGIVRAHNGAINVMSWPQKGTTIQVLLPATALARTAPEADLVGDDVASSGGTVLVIDDEFSVRRVTRSVLEHFGYQVLDAENGVRGLRVLEQNREKIDLVILDMSMPKMDGEETLRRIRELQASVPVVLTSGYTEVEINDRLGSNAASAFIGKPFSPKELIQQVRRLL